MGLESLPLVQPKQVTCAGVRELIQALQGVNIHLLQTEDDDSATSDMDASHSSLPQGYSETNPLGLDLKNPTDLEEEEISDHSSIPEATDQTDTLGHGSYPDGGITSDNGAAPGRISNFQSEDMDTTAQPSEVESYSEGPMDGQDAWYACSSPDSDWGDGESETAKHHRMYPKILSYMIPTPTETENRWYREEDLMDPREAAPPACRVGRPNTDGSIGRDKGHPLPPKRPGRQYYNEERELIQRVTYPRAERDETGRCSPITEQEHLDRAQCQDTACRGDAYWKEQLAQSHYLPTPEDSLVNFSYQFIRSTYHVVGPKSWEYPFHSGQALFVCPHSTGMHSSRGTLIPLHHYKRVGGPLEHFLCDRRSTVQLHHARLCLRNKQTINQSLLA